jgi:NADPH:quinone reductase-like Zn-dependent oxidoreductase
MASPSIPTSFRAWQYTTRNKPFESNLQLNTVPQFKVPASGLTDKKQSILVAVHAVSLNPVDYKMPMNPILGYWINSKPATPGLDFSGVIAQLPSGLKTDLKVGDRVIGRLDFPYQHGALAEYVLAQPNGLVKLPDSASFVQGAALGTAGLSALQPIEPYIKPGDNVFINGGSGGVGSFTIQIAKLLGAGDVTATCSSANAERVKQLGADKVIDYRSTDVLTALKVSAKDSGRIYDIIIENVGHTDTLYENSHHFLKPGGRFIQVAGTNLLFVIKRFVVPGFLGGGKRKYSFYLASNNVKQLQRIAKWVAEGKLQISVDEVFEFERAKEAFAKLTTERSKGKIVVQVVKD